MLQDLSRDTFKFQHQDHLDNCTKFSKATLNNEKITKIYKKLISWNNRVIEGQSTFSQ